MCPGARKRFSGAILFALWSSSNLGAASYAVVAGISQYGPQLRLTAAERLRFPEADAQALYGILLSAEGGNIPPENIRLLLGPAATKAAIGDALNGWLGRTATADDTVFVYFSGHGDLQGGQGYLITYDTVREDIPHTAFSLSELRRALGALRAKTKAVFLDACHSGALNQTAAATEQLRQSLLTLDGSTLAITASAAGQEALERGGADSRHTLFGQFLISGLDGYADADCNGVVTARELAGYLEAQVPKASGGVQTPSVSLPGALAALPLARYTAPRCTSASPPDQRGDLRVELDRFECSDSPAVVQLNGRTVGTICAEKALWIPGLPGARYNVRVSRTGMAPREQASDLRAGGQSVVTLQLAPRPPRSAAAERDIKKALDLYTKGGANHYKQALDTLEKVRTASSGDPEVDYRIGLVHKIEGAAAESRAAFQAALAEDPSYLMPRRLLADVTIKERPAEAIRMLLEVPEITANDVLSSAVLSRAYQSLHLCGESVQWAKTASERAPSGADLQAEPLVEWAESLKGCAGNMRDPETKKLGQEAAGKYQEALQRLMQFRSGTGGKLWYELGGAIGAGWKFDALNKNQYQGLLVDTYAGLCEVEQGLTETCAAINACGEWIHLRPNDAGAQLLLTVNTAVAARGKLACGGKNWTWPEVCASFESIPMSGVSPAMAQSVRQFGLSLRQSGSCPNLKVVESPQAVK